VLVPFDVIPLPSRRGLPRLHRGNTGRRPHSPRHPHDHHQAEREEV
jgi:hypothetical protein